jgi:hypothetical protein
MSPTYINIGKTGVNTLAAGKTLFMGDHQLSFPPKKIEPFYIITSYSIFGLII